MQRLLKQLREDATELARARQRLLAAIWQDYDSLREQDKDKGKIRVIGPEECVQRLWGEFRDYWLEVNPLQQGALQGVLDWFAASGIKAKLGFASYDIVRQRDFIVNVVIGRYEGELEGELQDLVRRVCEGALTTDEAGEQANGVLDRYYDVAYREAQQECERLELPYVFRAADWPDRALYYLYYPSTNPHVWVPWYYGACSQLRGWDSVKGKFWQLVNRTWQELLAEVHAWDGREFPSKAAAVSALHDLMEQYYQVLIDAAERMNEECRAQDPGVADVFDLGTQWPAIRAEFAQYGPVVSAYRAYENMCYRYGTWDREHLEQSWKAIIHEAEVQVHECLRRYDGKHLTPAELAQHKESCFNVGYNTVVFPATQNDTERCYCKPPQGDFDWSPKEPSAGQQVQFVDRSTPSNGNIVRWNWDFGDGSVGEGSAPTHVYVQPGVYTVRLEVWNDCGTDGGLRAIVRKQLRVTPAS